MITLFKNLWKFVTGTKGPNYVEAVPAITIMREQQLAEYKALHRKEVHSRLNSRGKTTLNRYPELEYNHLVFMTVPGFKELDGCGQKTAEHLYGTIQDYLRGFDHDMSYLEDINKGDDLDFDRL
jgi:hypothetical protein